ncbi:putative inorganic phosphate cotransporter [Trichogramma pretiosum]|uniref:putative inorganic phosphate cotransporter n=1 Tax=Trichogramma pretiosum TaxID=7493 RepID=UPI0006C972AB|nr:putative inorganic phosphate cotransporter [Trichogramma pretiosum]
MSGDDTIERSDEPCLESPKQQSCYGTRHCQVFLMALSLMMGNAMNLSLPVAIIAMTDTNDARNFTFYDWTTVEMALILSSFFWGYLLIQVPSRYFVRRYGAQRLFSVGLCCSSCVNFSIPLIVAYGDYVALCAARLIIGLCHACFYACTHALLLKWAPPFERSRMSSVITGAGFFGTIVAMASSGLIAASSLGWPGIFYIFGSLGLLCSFVIFFKIVDDPESHRNMCSRERDYILEHRRREAVRFEARKLTCCDVLLCVPLWALIVTECGSNWGTYIINSGMPSYMKYILDFNIRTNGLISTLPYLTNWLLSFAFSRLSDLALRRGVSPARVRRVSNTVGMWGPAAALSLLCLVDEYSLVAPVLLLTLAVGLQAASPSGFVVNQIEMYPNYVGVIYSTATCIGTSVSILAPIVCGNIIVDVRDVEQWHAIFYITAAVYFFINLIFMVFGRGETYLYDFDDTTNTNVSFSAQDVESVADRSNIELVRTTRRDN